MEADRRHTTTGFENPKSCFESCFDLAQLVVDGDADALKGSGRDMDVARPGPSGDGRLDRGSQIASGAQRASRHYELCDPASPTLFAIVAEDPFDLLDVEMVDDARRVERGVGVHPHVQRSLGAKAESALGCVELDTGKTEVEQDQVRRDESGGLRQGVHLAEATVDEDRRRPISGQRRSRGFDRRRIAVDPEQPAAWLDPVEDLAGMARLPQGAVDRDRARLGLQQLYYLL